MQHPSDQRPAEGRVRSCRGGMAILLVVLLAGFALIASQQLLGVAATLRLGIAERRLAAWDGERRLCERLVTESVYAAEEGLGDLRLSGREPFLPAHLRLLNAAVGAARYELRSHEIGGSLAGWMSMQGPGAVLVPLESVDLRPGTELGLLLRRGHVAPAARGRAQISLRLPGEPMQHVVSVQYQALGVPLTQYAEFGYILPEELGQSGARPWAGDVSFPSLAFGARLGGASGLGVTVRHRIAYGSTAYGRLFSAEGLERLLAVCGPTHVLDLRRDPSEMPTGNPRLSGVRQSAPGQAEVDLALLGIGARVSAAGPSIERRSGIVLLAGSGSVIRLQDSSASGAGAYPIGVIVVGEPGAAVPVRVEIVSALNRGLVLLLRSAVLAASRPLGRLPLALYLDPHCDLAVTDGFELAHLSCHASLLASVHRHGITASGQLSAPLEASCPRAVLVWSSSEAGFPR